MVNILNSGKLLNLRPQLAELIGLNEALVLQQIHFWLERSNHHYDDQTWVYNSVEQWAEQFPFWSKRTVERALASLREQGLIHTTTAYNSWKMDNRLWYTIDYEKLSAISYGDKHPLREQSSAPSDQPPTTNNRPPATSHQSDSPLHPNLADDVCQDDGLNDDNVAHTLYTENTNRDLYKEEQTITEVEDVVDDDPGAPDPERVEGSDPASTDESDGTRTRTDESGFQPSKDGTRMNADEHGSEKSASIRVGEKRPLCEHPCPEILPQLEAHGLSYTVAQSLAQQYPEEYLQEKTAYLEYELERRPDMTNPAGWLRCAIQQDYAPPPGYHAVQQAAAEKEKWQAILEEHTQQLLDLQSSDEPLYDLPNSVSDENGTRTRTDESGSESALARNARFANISSRPRPKNRTQMTQRPLRARNNLDENIRVTSLSASQKNSHPCSTIPVSQEYPLTQAWERGYHEVAEFMSIGGLLETLQQSILLSFTDGHATIGVKCQYALERLEMRGRNILRNALTFGLGEQLQGQRATYELVLV